ncbi:hypothetical protein ZWY2020_036026 [Hordeum vulgare]|nr:hypothetical protein ZWY2020_036026 [Hordeum vulgare]
MTRSPCEASQRGFTVLLGLIDRPRWLPAPVHAGGPWWRCSSSPALFPAAATSFTVGGKSGWTIGVDYTTWASGNTFKVGDSLVFNYAKAAHGGGGERGRSPSVRGGQRARLRRQRRDHRSPQDRRQALLICTITGHCAGGMKLEVTVSGSGSGPGSSSPTTPMPTPTTPYTSPTPTTPYTTPTTPYTTPTTPYTTPTSPACTGTTPGATPLTPVTPGTMPFYSYNGAAGLAPVAWASVALVCAAVAQLGLIN